MIVKRYTLDEIKKDIEVTSRIMDKRLLKIQIDNIRSEGRSIAYAMVSVAAVGFTALFALREYLFLYMSIGAIIIAIIILIRYSKLAKKFYYDNI